MVNNRMLISKRGRDYKTTVAGILYGCKPLSGRIKLTVLLHAPDKRRRDIDNFGGKALLDALGYAGAYEDDSQVDILHIVRGEVIKGGMVKVVIEEIADV